jgi:Conserved oligomeric complex COG6
MRYVGDMLAWVHQCIAAEREFLESLFGIKSDGRMVGSVRRFDRDNEDEEWIKELMDAAMSKLCIPLKVKKRESVHSQTITNMFHRSAYNRRSGHKKAVSCLLKLPTCCNFIC